MMVNIAFLAAILATAFCLTSFAMPVIIRKMKAAGIVGHDVNKPGRPEVAEMGGLGIVMGVVGALLLAMAMNTFFGYSLNLDEIMAAMLTMVIIALIGIFDDLFDMRKDVKTLLPMVAALPLVALAAAGSTTVSIPFIGSFDFGIFYSIVLIPLGVTVAANLTNMLAGFNGMEAGMGSVIFACVALLAVANGSTEAGLIAAAMLGALIAFLRFNAYPAKVFIGDIGTLLAVDPHPGIASLPFGFGIGAYAVFALAPTSTITIGCYAEEPDVDVVASTLQFYLNYRWIF